MVAHTARLNLTVQRSASPASSGGLNGLVERFPEGAGALPYRFATRVRRYVRAKAPVRTGYLKSSVNRTLVGPRAHRVTVGAHYGIYVNYGTRYMRAQPFWEPAIRQARMDLRKDMRKLLHG